MPKKEIMENVTVNCPHCGEKMEIGKVLSAQGLRAMPADHSTAGELVESLMELGREHADLADDLSALDMAEYLYNLLDNKGLLREGVNEVLETIIVGLKHRRFQRLERALQL